MKILIIRPVPGADASAARAAAYGLIPVIMPLFEAQPANRLASPFSYGPDFAHGPDAVSSIGAPEYTAMLITSARAIRFGANLLADLRHLPVYAVGQKSAEAARGAQLTVAVTGNAGADAVIALAARAGHRRLIWLTGSDHTPVTPPGDVMIDTHVVYQMAALPQPKNFVQIVQNADCTALHSAKAARYFAAYCGEHAMAKGAMTIAVYSQNVAMAAGGGWRNVIIAPQPTDDALFAAVRTTFTTGAPPP